MLFKCKNCGGNTLYDPQKGTMHCPHCDSLDSEEKIGGSGMTQCANCGAPLSLKEFDSAVKCPHCGSYLIFEERIEGEYTPHVILPFKVSKDQAVEQMKKEFHKRTFLPVSFLSQATIDEMEGIYVPYFLYDYDASAHYNAIGTKVHVYTKGDTEYRETSYYEVVRDLDVKFDKIPEDASKEMPDDLMALVAPYDYEALQKFQEKYMSGFVSEVYNFPSQELEKSANLEAKKNTSAILKESIAGYATLSEVNESIRVNLTNTQYALLPVWVYRLSFENQTYEIYINGQTGKVVGSTPSAKKKTILYTATVFFITMIGCVLLKGLLGV